MHAVGLFAVLFGTWVILSGHFTPFLLIAGAVCAALTVAITLRMDLLDRRRDFLGPVCFLAMRTLLAAFLNSPSQLPIWPSSCPSQIQKAKSRQPKKTHQN